MTGTAVKLDIGNATGTAFDVVGAGTRGEALNSAGFSSYIRAFSSKGVYPPSGPLTVPALADLDALPWDLKSLSGVRVTVRARRSQAESVPGLTIRSYLRLSGQTVKSPGVALPTSTAITTEVFDYETKPGGGAWSLSDLDALQAAAEVETSDISYTGARIEVGELLVQAVGEVELPTLEIPEGTTLEIPSGKSLILAGGLGQYV